MLNENKIIATAKKGTRKTVVNLEEEFIYFPKQGMFVAVEFLIVDQNKVKREKEFVFESYRYVFKYEPDFSTERIEEHPFNYIKDAKTQLWTKISSGLNTLNNSLECKIILCE